MPAPLVTTIVIENVAHVDWIDLRLRKVHCRWHAHYVSEKCYKVPEFVSLFHGSSDVSLSKTRMSWMVFSMRSRSSPDITTLLCVLVTAIIVLRSNIAYLNRSVVVPTLPTRVSRGMHFTHGEKLSKRAVWCAWVHIAATTSAALLNGPNSADVHRTLRKYFRPLLGFQSDIFMWMYVYDHTVAYDPEEVMYSVFTGFVWDWNPVPGSSQPFFARSFCID